MRASRHSLIGGAVLALGLVLAPSPAMMQDSGEPSDVDHEPGFAAGAATPGARADAVGETRSDETDERHPLLVEAERLFGVAEFEAALPLLERVVDELPTAVGDETPAVAAAARALDLRAQIRFMLGEEDAARADLTRLVETLPAYRLDETRVSPKLIELFRKVRASRVATLTVSGSPADAEVFLDDRLVGRTPLAAVEVLAGERELRLARAGFDTGRQALTLEAGADKQLEYTLVPNARGLLVRTTPPGIEVLLDGRPVGVTREDPSRLPGGPSLPLLLEAVPPGERFLLFRRECYVEETRRVAVSVDLTDNAPLDLDPVAMRRSRTSLSVSTAAAGAAVRVDGEEAVRLPATVAVCPGERDIEVLAGDRRVWFERRAFGVDEEVRLEIWPRPTLAVVVLPGATRSVEPSLLERPYLPSPPGGGFNRGALDRAPAAGTAPAAVTALLEGAGVDLLLGLGRGDDPVRAELVVRLWSRATGGLDEVRLPVGDAEALESFFDGLARPWPWLVADAGFEVFDRPQGPPAVGAVDPDGPAARAGLQPGDLILGVNGRPPSLAAEVSRAVSEAMAGDEVELGVQRGGEAFETSLELAGAVRVPAYRDRSVLYGLLLARAEADGLATGEPLATAAVALGRATALLAAGRHAEGLAAARAVPDAVAGDAAGHAAATARFLEALCLEALGYRSEAAEAYRKAAGYPRARYRGPGGVTLAPVAALRAERKE